jgi:hypothetical protein
MIKVEPHRPGSYTSFYLTSGDGEDYSGCRFIMAFYKWFISISLPPIIKPKEEKVIARSWNAEDVKRMGRNWYINYNEKRYGVSYGDNHLSFKYGLNGIRNSSKEQKSWGFFLPWNEWDMVRHSLYDLEGKEFWTFKGKFTFRPREGSTEKSAYDQFCEAKEKCPKVTFSFKDFDDEEILATTFIEEREWHRGEKMFKWLRYFCTPRISRSLDIHFSKETGKRKGSWKGGTIGHGINMLDGELHEDAFKRYCLEHGMTFDKKVMATNFFPSTI